MMKLAAIRQQEGELRAPLVPDLVGKFAALGFAVAVEAGTGAGAGFADAAFEEAGAAIGADAALVQDADVILTLRPPEAELIGNMKRGAVLIGLLEPYGDGALLSRYAAAGLSAFAMELMPRITRAQSMDVLSSQSNLAGYKAVIDGTALFDRAMPMMMTAAGTIAPARVFVMGAGVAGLQAIATAKRLGAIVSATDVRAAAKEQVESLGGKFVMVEDDQNSAQAETAGGYAREMGADYQRRQQQLIKETIASQDIVICTALIPGKPAPRLISADMVRAMKPGAIIIDLAAAQGGAAAGGTAAGGAATGGNCELSQADQLIEVDGVKIAGWTDLAARLAKDASTLYARNLLNFVQLMIDKERQHIRLDWEDEIIAKTALTKEGVIRERS